jgi:hypothetical protein
MRIALPAVILCRTLAAQIQSGENWVKSSENWEKLGISKKMICHQVWLSHLTRAIIGGALQGFHSLLCTGPHRKLPSLKTGSVYYYHCHCNALQTMAALKFT